MDPSVGFDGLATAARRDRQYVKMCNRVAQNPAPRRLRTKRHESQHPCLIGLMKSAGSAEEGAWEVVEEDEPAPYRPSSFAELRLSVWRILPRL